MSAFENETTETLRARLEALMASDAPSETESGELLGLLAELERRGGADVVRVDTAAALSRFRAEYLPSAETEPAPGPRLPAFLAAFSAGKKLSPREADEIRRMIDDFRKGES